jgi:hypothetical protein
VDEAISKVASPPFSLIVSSVGRSSTGVLVILLWFFHKGCGQVAGGGGLHACRPGYQYDERGNQIAEEVTNLTDPSLNRKSLSTYEYDSTGNWIRRTVRRLIIPVDQDGKPVSDPTELTERTITYD